MTLRDKRQKEFSDIFLNRNINKQPNGLLYLCARFGKCRVGINIFKKYGKNAKILISYPDSKIKESWESEFEILKYKNSNVVFTTHLSLHKHTKYPWDLVVLDECHLLSEAQIEAAQDIKSEILGLTGTMTSFTEQTLEDELNLPVIARYSIEQAILEGVITDYEIKVITVPLDTKIKSYKNNTRSEKQQFDALSWVIDKLVKERKDTFMLRLQRMRIIQNSIAKLNVTKKLLEDWKDERVLIFCGITKIADAVGCPVYHSKKGEKETFEAFACGEGNHLAVVKIGNTGVTYKPLNRVLINYFDSNGENLAQKINRCMAMEYNNPDKKSLIYIISSNESVELAWLKKALEFFDESKIKYMSK